MNNLAKSNKLLDIKLPSSFKKTTQDPYSATTDEIEVAVWPEYIDCQLSSLGNLFIWAYHVRIENRSPEIVKLLTRHWKIIDEQGTIQEIDGDGVVGEQPQILPFESFQYSSGVHLRYPSGIMTGHYEMEKENGEKFEIKIPAFSLDVPSIKNVIN